MTAATDEKAGWCGNCRGGSHALCMSARCSCPGQRRHSNRPTEAANPSSTLAVARDPEPAAATTKVRAATTTKPVIELVVEDPPPEVIVEKRSLLEQVVLLLDDDGFEPGRWHRVAIMPSSRSAKALATRLSKHDVTVRRKLEWRAADLKVFVKPPD